MDARSDHNQSLQNSTSRVLRPSRWLLLAAALVPCIWSLVQRVQGSPTVSHSSTSEEDRPALVFHQYLVNLGKVSARPVVGARFAFTNRGEHTVTITEAKPSCGCLKPRLAKREYAPGESGVFVLPVQTPNQSPGPHEYTLTVKYTDPQPRETVLTFKVTLPEKQVTVHPRALAIYQFGQSSTQRTITVSDYPRLGLKLTGAACDADFAAVKLGPSRTDEYGHPQYSVVVTVPAAIPPGRHRAVVSITTDHPRYPVLKVPLVIFGPGKTAQQRKTIE